VFNVIAWQVFREASYHQAGYRAVVRDIMAKLAGKKPTRKAKSVTRRRLKNALKRDSFLIDKRRKRDRTWTTLDNDGPRMEVIRMLVESNDQKKRREMK